MHEFMLARAGMVVPAAFRWTLPLYGNFLSNFVAMTHSSSSSRAKV